MQALKKDNFIYIPIPKNGLMTFTGLLESNGWERFKLFDNDLNLSEYVLWGHLTEPNHRHTRGVEQYIRLNPDINLSNPDTTRMLVSGVFDQHGYSVHMLLSSLMHLPIIWIPLDAKITNWNSADHTILDGNDLTNDFFKEHNLDLVVTDNDIKNKTTETGLKLQQVVTSLKERYVENYKSLVGNFLDPDIILYNSVIKKYRIKYGSKE